MAATGGSNFQSTCVCSGRATFLSAARTSEERILHAAVHYSGVSEALFLRASLAIALWHPGVSPFSSLGRIRTRILLSRPVSSFNGRIDVPRSIKRELLRTDRETWVVASENPGAKGSQDICPAPPPITLAMPGLGSSYSKRVVGKFLPAVNLTSQRNRLTRSPVLSRCREHRKGKLDGFKPSCFAQHMPFGARRCGSPRANVVVAASLC